MRRLTRQSGYTLIEVMVCIVLTTFFVGVAYATFHTSLKHAGGITRTSEDIVRTLAAGERWRTDIRSATAPPRVVEGILHIPRDSGEVLYRLSGETLERKAEKDGRWEVALRGVKTSQMMADPGRLLPSWRWEVELVSLKPRVRPLFTFRAVPPGNEQRGTDVQP